MIWFGMVQPRRGKTKPLGGFADRLDDQAVTPVAHDPSVDVLRGLSPIELEQDRAAAVDSNFPERLPVKQIPAHDWEGFLDSGSIKRLRLAHERIITANRPGSLSMIPLPGVLPSMGWKTDG
jgi:hypothetical protein